MKRFRIRMFFGVVAALGVASWLVMTAAPVFATTGTTPGICEMLPWWPGC